MSGSRCFFITMVLGLLVASPEPVLAQDCGTSCQSCGWFKKEGVNHKDGAVNDMRCRWGFDCKPCHEGQEDDPPKSLSDAGASETEIIRAILEAAPGQLAGIVARYKDRILLHHPRQILAVRGVGCSADHVTAVSFLGRDMLDALDRLAIPRLGWFLAEQGAAAEVQQ